MVKKTNQKINRQCCIDYHDVLIEQLKDREYAIEYLNAALQESEKGDDESQKLFLNALRYVAEAQGSMSDLAKRANIRRESVYRFLSKMENLDAVLTEIFAFLRRSLSSKPTDVKKSFINLRDKLETVSTSKYNRRSYQYLDIVSWLESKIDGVPVQEVIRRKFEKML